MPDENKIAPTGAVDDATGNDSEIEGEPPNGDTNVRADERAHITQPNGSPPPRA